VVAYGRFDLMKENVQKSLVEAVNRYRSREMKGRHVSLKKMSQKNT